MKFSSKNSTKTLYIALILLHAARLMTRLIEVRPAVDFSWKARYIVYKVTGHFAPCKFHLLYI